MKKVKIVNRLRCIAPNQSAVARTRAWRQMHVLFIPSILFADRRLIRAKFGTPHQTNGFRNQESSSKVIPFRFAKLASLGSLYLVNGGLVDPSWFGSSRKKDTVIVATLFGIVERALRRKNLRVDETVASEEFQAIRDLLNSVQFDSEMAARQNIISTSIPQPLLHQRHHLKKLLRFQVLISRLKICRSLKILPWDFGCM